MTNPVKLRDELLTGVHPNPNQVIVRPALYNNQPARQLLTEEERASGCRLYQVPTTGPYLRLEAGDLVVARPVAREAWSTLEVGDYYILNEQMEAFDNHNGFIEAPYEAEQLIRVIGNVKKKRSFQAVVDCGGGYEDVVTYRFSALLDIYRLTRLIRTL
jgi:hypothetical protein